MHGLRLAWRRADADGYDMTDVTPCPDPDALLVLLYDDEGAPDERACLQAHVLHIFSAIEIQLFNRCFHSSLHSIHLTSAWRKK